MNTLTDESTAEKSAKTLCAACRGTCAEDISKRVERAAGHAKAAVSETLEDGKSAAVRLVKRGLYAVDDGIDETAHAVKRHPLTSMAVAFAAGTLLGFVGFRFAKR
jgi:ElaB/YqjD/DUF883 family membrane-anchored ribosome-binding protein